MRVRRPTEEELRRIASANHFRLTKEESRIFTRLADLSLRSLEKLDGLETPGRAKVSGRRRGHAPSAKENRLGAWAWRCSIRARRSGPLSGKKVAIKDNVSVAKIPLTNGSRVFRGYVPVIDATIVTRILQAGGTIAGKSTCENLCVSGGSHTSYPVPVRNPYDPRYMSGGSSSGSAVLVATGAVDLAVGSDQAGSVRIPSAWCGIFGLKPTWGLVPYTGAIPMEFTIDHLGPMARSARALAVLLQVMAGRDGLDPRQTDTPWTLPPFAKSVGGGAKSLSVGIVREGFGWPGSSEEEVDGAVMDASDQFRKLGAHVQLVSIPEHLNGRAIWSGVATEGTFNLLMHGSGLGFGWKGYNDSHLADYYNIALRERSNHLPPNAKMTLLLGRFLSEERPGWYYRKAQDLRRSLGDAYDRALAIFDVLLMPTTLTRPPVFRKGGLMEYIEDTGQKNLLNTAPFDVTGHPAMNVPCGFIDGLPVGMMLVGRRFDEATLLRAAHAFEVTGFGSKDRRGTTRPLRR